MITTLLEISTTKCWMADPAYLNALRAQIQENVAGRILLRAEDMQKRAPYSIGMTHSEDGGVQMSVHNGEICPQEQQESEMYVRVLSVCGPITRNGDACSYGSIDLRDSIMRASDSKDCAGIILYINSGGGSAAAIPDYKYAINYAHEQNKKVVAFVDGMCASAALYLACLCDERYYMNEKDQIGSVGVMAAFYTEKTGDKNIYTNETYHELYADESYQKNKWHRDATEGDYEELKADLNALAAEFMADVKAACPKAKDEHLHGAMFDAKDIDGVLMDGQSTLTKIATAMCEDYSKNTNSKTNHTQMNANYQTLAAVCGVEELVVTEEGTHLDLSLLDALQQNITSMQEQIAQIEGLNSQISSLQAQLADAQGVQTTMQETIDAHLATIAERDASIAQANTDMEALRSQMEEAQNANTELTQQNTDLQAQVEALQASAGAEPEAGATPASNGEGVATPSLKVGMPAYDPTKSPIENKKIREAYEAELKAMVASKTCR